MVQAQSPEWQTLYGPTPASMARGVLSLLIIITFILSAGIGIITLVRKKIKNSRADKDIKTR